MIDPTAILALISDLYGQIGRLADENKQLREALGAQTGDQAPTRSE